MVYKLLTYYEHQRFIKKKNYEHQRKALHTEVGGPCLIVPWKMTRVGWGKWDKGWNDKLKAGSESREELDGGKN